MNTKHTPGPWKVFHDCILSDSGKIAEICTKNEISKNTWHENAYLIAAAPELLEALQNLLDDVEYSQKDIPAGAIGQRQIRAAKAAIQKATNQ